MGNNFISLSSLPLLSDFLNRRESIVSIQIDDLSPRMLESRLYFEQERERLEKEVFLVPVTLGEIEFLTCETVKVKGNFKNQFRHKLAIPYTGDRVLFTCSPSKKSGRLHEKSVVIIPIQNSIVINVALDEYNPELALEEAKKQLQETELLLKRNNTAAIEWNNRIKKKINDLLKEKKDQIIKNNRSQTYRKEIESALLRR